MWSTGRARDIMHAVHSSGVSRVISSLITSAVLNDGSF
jgi:hypothetical protein